MTTIEKLHKKVKSVGMVQLFVAVPFLLFSSISLGTLIMAILANPQDLFKSNNTSIITLLIVIALLIMGVLGMLGAILAIISARYFILFRTNRSSFHLKKGIQHLTYSVASVTGSILIITLFIIAKILGVRF